MTMRFSEVHALAKGIPSLYAGRKKIDPKRFRGVFTVDAEIIAQLTPKMIEDSEGNETPMLNKAGDPVFDKLIYLPIESEGEKMFAVTKSPIIWRIVRNLPKSREDEKNIFDDIMEYHENFEGLVRFCEEDYRYGDKTAPVLSLEAAEE